MPDTTLVRGMDVSSAQPRDLSALIAEHQPGHVVVKLYQTIENISQDYSAAQIASAQADGCTVGGYVWLYGGVNIEQQVHDAVALARRCGVALPILWVDCETYTDGTYPTLLEALSACEAAERLGVKAGIYTGNWFVRDYWKPVGGIGELKWRPAWLADYNGQEDLNTPSPYWPAEMVLGHQYQGSPIDLSTFARSVTVAS